MDLPQSPLGWANLFAHAWAAAAYLTAAIAGVRALRCAYDHVPAWPLCLVVDATRWVFGRSMSPRAWRPRDFVSLGVFGAVLACLFGVSIEVEFLTGMDWRKLGGVQALQQAAGHVVTGSALIILHCGIALRFQKDREAGR
jgi:hypothetical protein